MDEIIHVTDRNRADIRFQDGALPHLRGVKSCQILRANRAHPQDAEGFGWTYNHAPMLCYAFDTFFCQFLSNPVDEHETPGHTLLSTSKDGVHWDRPRLLFPEIEIGTAPYKGPKSPLLKPQMLTVPHQRMGFYMAKNGVLLTLSFYGLVHDRRMSMPCDGWGVGRAVRRIFPDGGWGDIYFLMYNEAAGFTADNADAYPPYTQSGDGDFVAACEELLGNGAAMRQMYEEQRYDQALFPRPSGQAFCFYTVEGKDMVGVYKKSLASVSHDGGKTWTDPQFQPTVHTMSGKVWGQRTSDGKFTLMYNPTTDGQHRWPIAAVTGEDGHTFGHLSAVTGEMSSQRYGGIDKNLGPQYMRGIAECNPQTPDGDVWLVYSNNKEDIWISRIPVPLTARGEDQGALDLSQHELPRELGVYSPAWAPVSLEEGAVVLRDRDPYDRAAVEAAIGKPEKGKVTLALAVDSVAPEGSVTLEMQDDQGRMPIQMIFRHDGVLYLRGDGRIDPWLSWTPGEILHLEIAFDAAVCRTSLRLNGAEKQQAFNASVNEVTRLRLMTKQHIPALSTLDDCGKYGKKDQVKPGCEEQTEETRVRLLALSWESQAAH